MAVEFLTGGLAASGACFFTNPLEVAKTRMQLQGELVARGQHAVHYRNVVHAFFTIGRVDGLLALQKGLVPGLWYQFVMNGVRLGFYQRVVDMGLTKDKNGRVSVVRSVAAGAFSGCIGAAVGSPLYMVKTHLQARANEEIAVGHQHEHGGMAGALRSIFRTHGIRGLWRGVTGAIVRVSVGSATQLTAFSWTKEHIIMLQLFSPTSWLNALAASMTSGVFVVMMMTPFDVVSTRLYNQGTDAAGRGLLYRGVADCFVRTFATEGIWGFYKGCGASFFRLGPHTVLSLMFWNQLQAAYQSFNWTAETKL